MRRRGFMLALSAIGAGAISPLVKAAPYDESAVPADDFAAALVAARNSRRRVLVVFGANWCKDCRKLDADLQSPPLSDLVAREFVVVKVDVGQFDKNLDFVGRFGKPIAKGIPSVAVADAEGRIVHVALGGELANARSMSGAQVERYFRALAARRG